MPETSYCKDCNKPFFVFERDCGFGGKEREPIDCPYCRKVVETRMTNGSFETKAMTAEQINEYISQR